MKTTDETLVLKTGDLGEVLGLLGILLGFQPHDSLIVIALTGERRRMTFKIRCDLTDPDHAPEVAQFIGEHMDHHGAESVLVFAVGDDVVRCDTAVQAVFGDCADRGLPITGAARAHAGWYWTYDEHGEPGIDPPRPYDAEASPQVVEAMVHGVSVAPSREALVAAFDPPHPERVAALVPIFERAAAEVSAFRDSHGWEAFVERGMVVHDRLRGRQDRLEDLGAARLAVWVSADVQIRDYAWRRLTLETAREDLAFWEQIVTRTIAPFEPAVLSLCGVAAWLQGSGAIAQTVWERALEADPDYSMAQLMLEGLGRGVPPEALASIF